MQNHSHCHHDYKPAKESPEQFRKVRFTPARCTRRSGQKGPGSCPICGMALEPETVTGEEGLNPELIDMKMRFWIGLLLTLPVLFLEMGAHVFNLHVVEPQTSNWGAFPRFRL